MNTAGIEDAPVAGATSGTSGAATTFAAVKTFVVANKIKVAVAVLGVATIATVAGVVASSGGDAASQNTPPDVNEFNSNGGSCDFYPTTLTVINGRSSEHSIGSLRQSEMSGSALLPSGSFVEFSADEQGRHISELEFELPEWVFDENSAPVKGISLRTNSFRQNPQQDTQPWNFLVRNQQRKVWEAVWTDSSLKTNEWVESESSKPVLVTTTFQDYVHMSSESKTRKLTLRLATVENAANSTAQFDSVAVCLGTSTPKDDSTPQTPLPEPPTRPDESCYALSKLQPVIGTLGKDQSVEHLKSLNQQGSAVNWDQIVEFTPGASSAEFVMHAPVDMSNLPANLTSISAYLNYRGPDRGSQQWSLEAYNFAQNTWSTVLENGSSWWKWTLISGSVETAGNDVLDFIQPDSNVLKFRWVSDSAADASQLDFVRLCVAGTGNRNMTSTRAPVTSAPTSSTTQTKSPTRSPTASPSKFPTTSPSKAPSASPTRAPIPAPAPVAPPTAEGECYNSRNTAFEDWSYQGGVCGVYASTIFSDEELASVLAERKAQGCYTLMLDPLLSYYMNDAEFESVVAFIDRFAKDAIALGMYTIVYYPTLEIVSTNADSTVTAGTAFASWLQLGLNGEPNKFVGGGKEHWVGENEESAWFDPESPYTDYFIARCIEIAKTAAHGLWGDVPLYYDTGASWAGGSTYSATAFKAWSNSKGLCPDTSGCSLPDPEPLESWDYSETEFHYWLEWRHHSIAAFLNKVRVAIRGVNPDMTFMVENYPADYIDATYVALDAAYFSTEMREGMSTVWETDSVSNDNAMKFAHPEDFANQLTMRKFARGMDKNAPSWTFAYGNEEADSAHVVGGAFAVGTNPLETKTPSMTQAVSSSQRTAYFNWVKDHSCEVMQTERIARAAVLYSSATRDHSDLSTSGCGYAMYLITNPTPSTDKKWWALSGDDSLRKCPHIADYRGASYALQMLHVPFKIVNDIALEPEDLEGVEFLWMPSTPVLPDSAITVIDDWVAAGGVVLSSGAQPGIRSELIETRVLGMNKIFQGANRNSFPTTYGSGFAYRDMAINAADAFLEQGGSVAKQAQLLSTIRDILEAHLTPSFKLESDVKHIFVEQSIYLADRQHLYIMNYNGMKRPATHDIKTIQFVYKPPRGWKVVSFSVYTPNEAPATNGEMLSFESLPDGWVRVQVTVDIFSLVTFGYAPDTNNK